VRSARDPAVCARASSGRAAAASSIARPRGPSPRVGHCGRPGPVSVRVAGSAAELFSLLFPSGDQMTGELFTDLEQWARLTSKLAAQGRRMA
jgi:hypothetical protein